jgi:transposase InsO family protein
MKAENKVIKHKLSVFELAKTLGNVAAACRQRGVSKTQFYEWKRRFQTHGIEGLRDLPPIVKNHPFTTPPEVVERIKKMATGQPSRGCGYYSELLAAEGISVSKVTVQKILDDNGLGKRYDRWLALEKMNAEGIELTAEQVAFIEKENPQFRERHVESSKPGELLSQDTFYVGRMKGVGKVYLHAVIDTHGSYAFGFLHTNKKPEAAVAVVHNDVLPFYEKHGIEVGAILTDNGTEFCGTDAHPYELYLELCDIEHRRTRVRRPQTNGFIERFNRTILDEFFRIAFRKKLYESVAELQKDMDAWLAFYNTERPHQGYRNMGRKPIETILGMKRKTRNGASGAASRSRAASEVPASSEQNATKHESEVRGEA